MPIARIKSAIVLHHSFTRDSRTVSWDAIREYHMHPKYQGKTITEDEYRRLKLAGKQPEPAWGDIGYQAGTELVGDIGDGGAYQVMLGRAWQARAAAVREASMNQLGIHICMVGNFDDYVVPAPQWELTGKLAAYVCAMQGIQSDRIFGHRDFAPYKSCPGQTVDMDAFRALVCGYLAAGSPEIWQAFRREIGDN